MPKVEIEVEKEPKKKKIEDYEVDSACDCLMRAEEIKKNKDLMALVHKKLSGKESTIKSIKELREKAAEMEDED